ncbi:leucine rich repeat protein 1 L homeolog [Xenopus laevis]|uniref:Leucine rich repeat protein 1 L homeolog n=1 Tax=Xenopus laevis TaxID=8355 RepID=Q6INL6_XENLA|nr:leucine rich repeat protein 1 L homeolog [Xenopus laevis]AAH72264.1 MGC82386 protein [Xenopus laevis]
MKLQCEVEVINRMLPTFGLKNRGKGTRAVLSVGRQEGKRGAAYLMICTLKDKSGSRYKLENNIEQLFTRFVGEGKATLRLKEPALDICLSKAEICGLRNFISTVGLANKGTDIEFLTDLISSLLPSAKICPWLKHVTVASPVSIPSFKQLYS